MKLTYLVTIDIDPDRWAEEYAETAAESQAALDRLRVWEGLTGAIVDGIHAAWPVLASVGTVRVGVVQDLTPQDTHIVEVTDEVRSLMRRLRSLSVSSAGDAVACVEFRPETSTGHLSGLAFLHLVSREESVSVNLRDPGVLTLLHTVDIRSAQTRLVVDVPGTRAYLCPMDLVADLVAELRGRSAGAA